MQLPSQSDLEKIQDELPSFEDDFLPICDNYETVSHPDDSELDSDDDDDDEIDYNIRDIDSYTALNHLQELSKFLLKNGSDCMDVYNLKNIVYDAIDCSKKQTKITDYFKN